jgi:membrane-bound hydrogenase subunit mbhJ
MSITRWALKKSPWVYHVALSPCNNCDIEILDVLTPDRKSVV